MHIRGILLVIMVGAVPVVLGGCSGSGTTEEPALKATVIVDCSPDGIDCPWQLTGPNDYSQDGQGDETLSEREPGEYTLTWGTVLGYDGPSLGSETKDVTADATTTFDGTYTPVDGTVALDLTNVDLAQTGYVRVADDPDLEPQVFTIEAWITPQAAGIGGADAVGNVVIGKLTEQASGVNLGSWSLTWSPMSETVLFFVVHQPNTSSAVTVEAPMGTVPVDSTHHVAGTFDGATAALYVDGTLEATGDFSWSDVYYGDEDVLIGAANFGTPFDRRFDGMIDDLRLWDHARSIEEITAHMSCELSGNEAGLLAYWSFETGGLTDDSGNGHDGVAENVGDAVDFATPQVSLPGCPP